MQTALSTPYHLSSKKLWRWPWQCDWMLPLWLPRCRLRNHARMRLDSFVRCAFRFCRFFPPTPVSRGTTPIPEPRASFDGVVRKLLCSVNSDGVIWNSNEWWCFNAYWTLKFTIWWVRLACRSIHATFPRSSPDALRTCCAISYESNRVVVYWIFAKYVCDRFMIVN